MYCHQGEPGDTRTGIFDPTLVSWSYISTDEY